MGEIFIQQNGSGHASTPTSSRGHHDFHLVRRTGLLVGLGPRRRQCFATGRCSDISPSPSPSPLLAPLSLPFLGSTAHRHWPPGAAGIRRHTHADHRRCIARQILAVLSGGQLVAQLPIGPVHHHHRPPASAGRAGPRPTAHGPHDPSPGDSTRRSSWVLSLHRQDSCAVGRARCVLTQNSANFSAST